MNATTVRKRRLEQLLGLAQAYRGCSRKELAKTLGRDPTKLVPGTGIPKLDLVVELAGVLDWPLGEVAAFLWNHQSASRVDDAADFESLNKAAGDAHRSGRYDLMLDLARGAYAAATTPEQRTRSCNREAGAWDGLGRYTEELGAIKKGLQETGVAPELRRMLQSNLANAYYSLWALVESGSISQDLLNRYQAHPPRAKIDRKTQAFAYYVSGHTLRRLISVEPDRAGSLVASASLSGQRRLGEPSHLSSYNLVLGSGSKRPPAGAGGRPCPASRGYLPGQGDLPDPSGTVHPPAFLPPSAFLPRQGKKLRRSPCTNR